MQSGVENLMKHAGMIKDPRQLGKIKFKLADVVAISMLAMLCGASNYKDIETFAVETEDWIRSVLMVEGQLPTRFVVRRLLSAIDPDEFSKQALSWFSSVVKPRGRETICIDGKAMRGSANESAGLLAIMTVSAYAAKGHLCLAQAFVPDKKGELVGTRQILDMIAIKGNVITMDAMGTRPDIAETIIKKKGDYMMALKGNNELLFEDIKLFMQEETIDPDSDFKFITKTTANKDHGRVEERTCHATSDLSWLAGRKEWPGLKSVWMVTSAIHKGAETSSQVRYYLSSLPAEAKNAKHIREHWQIENNLHWHLDVSFKEDACKVRNRNAAKNLGTLRKTTLSLLKNDKKTDAGIAAKRFKASLSPRYRETILDLAFSS